jgi:hypothetical protein
MPKSRMPLEDGAAAKAVPREPPSTMSARGRSRMDDTMAIPAYRLMPFRQGLALVHFSAQRKRFLLDRGYINGCLEGV